MGAFVWGPAARDFAGRVFAAASNRNRSARRRHGAVRIAVATSCAAGVAGVLAACTVVSSSTQLGPETDRRSAFAYMLPKAVLPLELRELRGNFIINAAAPTYVGDPRHLYYVNYNGNPLSSDVVDVTVDSNGLLKTVNVTAEDQTGQFLINLAKSYGAIKTFGKEASLQGSELVAQVDVDPDDPYSMRAAEDAFAAAVKVRIRAGIRVNCGPAAANDPDKVNLCGVYNSLAARRPEVKLTAFAPDLVPQARLPDCSVGVCYRLPVPYRVSAGFTFGKDVAVSSVIVPLPNGGPVVATNFARAPFVRKVINAGFTNGVLTSLRIEKPSEAVAVAILPAEIIKALFASIGETFTSRRSALDAEVAYLNALHSVEAKRSEKESSLLGAGTSIMSVGMGAPAPVSGTGRTSGVTNQETAGTSSAGNADAGGTQDAGESPFVDTSEGCPEGNCTNN